MLNIQIRTYNTCVGTKIHKHTHAIIPAGSFSSPAKGRTLASHSLHNRSCASTTTNGPASTRIFPPKPELAAAACWLWACCTPQGCLPPAVLSWSCTVCLGSCWPSRAQRRKMSSPRFCSLLRSSPTLRGLFCAWFCIKRAGIGRHNRLYYAQQCYHPR